MSSVTNYTSPEATAALKRQRRVTTISSIVVSILVVALLGLIMALILLPGFFVETGAIVTYSANSPEEDQVEKPEMVTQVQRKPSAPSSSMAKVIASTTPAPTAIPVPEVNIPDPSVDFGSGDDFGEGWGGSGGGVGGGGASFFGQNVSAERIAYVIDFSNSMKRGGREQLMRKELQSSLDQIVEGTSYALIFFAGPAWVAGSTFRGSIVIAENGKPYLWKRGGDFDWQHNGEKQPVDWLVATSRQLKKSKKNVEETRLIGGTVWTNPLMMALDMDPQPQVIYFMTDGAARGSDIWAKEVGDRAKKLGVMINCVALMQPQAHNDLHALAKTTGGQFTIVKEDGKREKVR